MSRSPWRAKKSNGPRPRCRECRREEAIAGGLCETCRPRLYAQKKAAAEKLKACHEIAERLYKLDRAKYRDLFAWINAQVKKRKSLTLILHSLERVESLNLEPLNSSAPRGDVWAYLEGTLRRLEEKSEADKLRAGRGPTKLGDISLNLRDLARMKGG